MNSCKRVLWALLLLVPLIASGGVLGQKIDDASTGVEEPDVTARVARFSFIRGDVQIRRTGNKDWERATLNLPVVEADEVSTGPDSRAEIQLDSTSHLRINSRSYLKISTLKDGGTALSISQGTMSVRLLEFDASKSFFEIDAPMTTVAIQKSGIYRTDTGTDSDKAVRVSTTEFGEARVYTDSSGFTLHNGRSARINIDGQYAGEYDTADAAKFVDEFDSWSLDRDVVIAKHLKDAYYDKYYDRDIYGAEDLNDSGDWIYTKNYGYVWRPFATTLQSYPNWSPYRYGSWRWVPPYGWTWVNDEPWGWATYHHGRWIYDSGYWAWSPYGYVRGGRSWWWPALVVFHAIRDSYCWYPLPYTYASYNFNYYYHNGHRDRERGRNDRDGNWSGRPAASPTPGRITGPDRMQQMPYYNVPVGGIVTVNADDFGSGRGNFGTPSSDVAKIVLATDPQDVNKIPRLPKFEDVSSRVSKDVRSEVPPTRPIDNFRIGAAERKDQPVDNELRTARIRGGRQPIEKSPDQPAAGVDEMQRGGARMRETGAVQRPVQPKVETQDRPVKAIPRSEPPQEESKPSAPSYEPPRKIVMPKVERPKDDDQPRSEAPQRSVPSKIEPPKSEEPKREQPKAEPPPQREVPRSEPPPKRDDPPPRQEQPKPKDEPKIEKPSIIDRKKDGR